MDKIFVIYWSLGGENGRCRCQSFEWGRPDVLWST